jgi:putative ubiquitin-RnfH superfamily antitoxin RatB of RatAB toxin-antitoxin module
MEAEASRAPGAVISVEVCYALAESAIVRVYRLTVPACVADALRAAAEDPAFAGVDLNASPVGIFGRSALPSSPLDEGDRVEIYRPLNADPKIARRTRAKESRQR